MTHRSFWRAVADRWLVFLHGAPASHAGGTSRLVVARGEPGGPVPMFDARSHHHPRTTGAVAYLFLLVGLFLLNAADTIVTVHWTDRVTWDVEGNSFLRVLGASLGTVGFIGYKLGLFSVVALLLWWIYLQVEDGLVAARSPAALGRARAMHRAVVLLTAALVAFYAWVLGNNLRVTGLL